MTGRNPYQKLRLSRLMKTAICGLTGIAIFTGANVARSARNPDATPVSSLATKSVEAKKHWYQIGRASWYGGSFQGRETASGENYNMTDLTCAHRSLPLGTLVRVTNLDNHKSVVVRVNDRGPMIATRVVDLSYAAAHFLGFRGTARVRLDVLARATQLAAIQNPLPVMGR